MQVTTQSGWKVDLPNTPEYTALQTLPKAELHIHAGGAFPPGFLLANANHHQLQRLTEFIERLKSGMNYEEAFGVFPLISEIVDTIEKLEEGVYQICESLKADGVTVAELRSGLKKLGNEGEEAYLQALIRGINRAASATFTCRLLLSVKRESTREFVDKTVDLATRYMDAGVVGIDISGESTKGTIEPHIQTLKKARDLGLFITAHIGESYNELDQMLILQQLNPHRVGHGVCLSTAAINWIKDHNTPIEVCLTSAKLTRMHEPHEVHPWILEHTTNGHPIILCTDDPTVFGVNPTDEYYSLRGLLTNQQIQELANGSFKHAFKPLPRGWMPFAQYDREFALSDTSTELRDEGTRALSQVLTGDVAEGMKLLLEADKRVVTGFESFVRTIQTLAPKFAENIRRGGRVFLVGSGSSGRVGVDIAAKLVTAFPDRQGVVIGLVAGGDAAMIRPKEGFEDSAKDGKELLKAHNIGVNDTVILVSASGSASFNEGCGTYAADQSAQVLYFYNSKSVPDRTRALFERQLNPVKPLCVDIGPQAVSGSTRLQAATLAECCLGALLTSSLYHVQSDLDKAHSYPYILMDAMKKGTLLIENHLDDIAAFSKVEQAIFSNLESNFRRIKDETFQGYLTFVAKKDSMGEVLIDSTETAPTFNTNPIRRANEAGKKRPEFCAYLVGEEDNLSAWKALLAREVDDVEDVDSFTLSHAASGINSYACRPTGKGNFVIAVAKVDAGKSAPQELEAILDAAAAKGGNTGLVLLCRGAFDAQKAHELRAKYGPVLILQNVPFDALGYSETIVLKQVLNLISNASMVLMNKVHGNLMIDVRASNNKLKGRCVRLVQEIWNETPGRRPLTNEFVYHAVAQVSACMDKAKERGEYVPSVVKIVLEMLALSKGPDDFEEVVASLRKNQERLTI